MCVFILSTIICEIFLILRRTQSDNIINAHRFSLVPVIFPRFLWNLYFLAIFSNNNQIPNFVKIRLVGAELFYKDRLRTDGRGHDEAGSCFSQFGEIV